METLRELAEDPEHKNWYKGQVALRVLLKHLKPLIDEETEKLHKELRNNCGPHRCDNNCTSKNQGQNQGSAFGCEVWKKEIKEKHHSGKLMWVNSKSNRFPENKWEVAKVFMPGGHKEHNSIEEFDISAMLTLMDQCKQFQKFQLGPLCNKVANVRNYLMHSPKYGLEQEKLSPFLDHIRDLGNRLSKHNSDFHKLAEEIDEILELDFKLVESKEYQEAENTYSAALQLVSEYRNCQNSLEEEVMKLEELLSERDQEIETLRLKNKITVSQSRIAKHQLQNQETMIAMRDQELQNLRSIMEKEKAQHEQQKIQADSLSEEITVLRELLYERDEEIQALHSSYTTTLQRQQEDIAQREREIQNMQSAVSRYSCVQNPFLSSPVMMQQQGITQPNRQIYNMEYHNPFESSPVMMQQQLAVPVQAPALSSPTILQRQRRVITVHNWEICNPPNPFESRPVMVQQQLAVPVQAPALSSSTIPQWQQQGITQHNQEIHNPPAPVGRNTINEQVEMQPPSLLIAMIGGILLALFAFL